MEEPAPIRDRVSAARTGRPWTAEDWAFVEAHMVDMSAAEIGAVLGRTASGIHKRLRKAGLSKPHPPRKFEAREDRSGLPWTPEEDEMLADCLTLGGVRSVSSQLRRSERAVRKRMYEVIGVRGRDDGFLSVSDVAALYRCPRWRVSRMVKEGRLESRRAAGGRIHRIDPADCERLRVELSAPKQTHKGSAPDVGDWAKRYGYRRPRTEGGRRWVDGSIPWERVP